MNLTEFDDRRIRNYLGERGGQPARSYKVGRTTDVVLCGASECVQEVLGRYSFRYPAAQFLHLHKMYIEQAQKIVCQVNPMAQFCVYPDDLRAELPVPVFTKSRRISASSQCVLLPLNRQRHWGDIASVDSLDIPFAQKDDKIVWRGATTGKFMPNADLQERYSSRAYIYSVAANSERVDIGFNAIVQLPEDWPVLALLRSQLRPGLSIGEQLRSKYLLSIEGNDVASGLKWMLYSNSVVIMPAPICESWACERFLVPYEHYVPIRHDLSDLNEIHEWCISHPKECEAIAQNGREFIKNFLDPERETRICNEVVSGYLATVQFTTDEIGMAGVDIRAEAVRARAAEWTVKGELTIAERILEHGVRAFPDWSDDYGDPVFLKDLVKLCLNTGRFGVARDILARHREGRPGWYEILFARALENTGQFGEALCHWHAFLNAYPDHVEAKEAVRRLGVARRLPQH